MRATFALLTVLVFAQSSFAAVNSGVNQDDPNNFTDTKARLQRVAPKSCETRSGKDLLRTIQPNGESQESNSQMARGASAGSRS